jgi:hypothetical protein
MLTILLIFLIVLLLFGGIGYSRRGRRIYRRPAQRRAAPLAVAGRCAPA